MLTLKTLAIGSDMAPAQYPIRDFSRAARHDLAAGVELAVALAPGHYEIRADVAFAYKHGPAAAVAGYVSVPHDAGVWLGVSTEDAQELRVTAATAGKLWIVPAETL